MAIAETYPMEEGTRGFSVGQIYAPERNQFLQKDNRVALVQGDWGVLAIHPDGARSFLRRPADVPVTAPGVSKLTYGTVGPCALLKEPARMACWTAYGLCGAAQSALYASGAAQQNAKKPGHMAGLSHALASPTFGKGGGPGQRPAGLGSAQPKMYSFYRLLL